jgi:hypothetical protein
MRTKLSKQATNDVVEYIRDRYNLDIAYDEILRIIDNNLGFIVDMIEEQALEVDIK